MQSGSVLNAKRNVTPLSSVFISFSPVLLFPWYLLQSPRFLLEAVYSAQDPTSSQGRLCCGRSSCICWPPIFASSSDALTFLSIVPLAHTQPSPCLLVWPWYWALPVLCASYAHGSTIPFLGKDTGHMDRAGHSTFWVLLICGLCTGPLFMEPYLFTKCVPVMAAGYPEALRCPDPECHRERWENSKHPLPAHLGTSSRKKGLNNSYSCSPPKWTITFLGKGGFSCIFTLVLRGYGMAFLRNEWTSRKVE